MNDTVRRDIEEALDAAPPTPACTLRPGSGQAERSEREDGSFFRGVVIMLPIALWLWAVLIIGLAIWAGWRPWRELAFLPWAVTR